MAAYRSRPPARSFSTAPSLEEIEEIAGEALASIPEDFRRHTANVHIHVDDFPSEEVEKTMELESPFDILGLYQGVSMAERSVDHVANDTTASSSIAGRSSTTGARPARISSTSCATC